LREGRNNMNNLTEKYTDKERGGMFDLPKENVCRDPEHEPPTHISIPHGKGYRHICPSCGKKTVLIPTQFTL